MFNERCILVKGQLLKTPDLLSLQCCSKPKQELVLARRTHKTLLMFTLVLNLNSEVLKKAASGRSEFMLPDRIYAFIRMMVCFG